MYTHKLSLEYPKLPLCHKALENSVIWLRRTLIYIYLELREKIESGACSEFFRNLFGPEKQGNKGEILKNVRLLNRVGFESRGERVLRTDNYRTLRIANHTFCNTTHQQLGDSLSAISAHYNKIGTQVRGQVADG